MKIERISLNHLKMPLISRFETSFGQVSSRECILITIFSEGLSGYGECVADREPGYSYETVGTSWLIIKEFFIPLLIGKEINSIDEWKRLSSGIRGHQMAKAGIEMALWDLLGKSQGKSLHSMLNGQRPKVDVGVSIGIQKNSLELINVVENFIQEGYARIKLKIKPGRDLSDVTEIRKKFPSLRLQVDANSAYTLESFQELSALDELNLLMIEQPLAEDDLWEHHFLQEKLKTPICLDESITSTRQARAAIEMKACKIINIKAGRVGGISEAIGIHDYCEAHGIPNWCGGMLETGVGRASNLALASKANFCLPGDISATNRYYREDITNELFTLNPDSTIDVPDGIGLGISINKRMLKKYTLKKEVFQLRRLKY